MLKDYMMLDLSPTNGRKSFYGNAKVVIVGNDKFLYSYDTPVAALLMRDGQQFVHRLWDGRSATTTSHIKAWLYTTGLQAKGCSVKAFYDLPLTDIADIEGMED